MKYLLWSREHILKGAIWKMQSDQKDQPDWDVAIAIETQPHVALYLKTALGVPNQPGSPTDLQDDIPELSRSIPNGWVELVHRNWHGWWNAILNSESVKLNRRHFQNRLEWKNAVQQTQRDTDVFTWFSLGDYATSRKIIGPIVHEATLWFTQKRQDLEEQMPEFDVARYTEIARTISANFEDHAGRMHAEFSVLGLPDNWTQRVNNSTIACSIAVANDESQFQSLIEQSFVAGLSE